MTTLITRSDLQSAIDAGSATVLDTLAGAHWEKRHLPGAIPLHADHVEQVHRDLLPDRDALIVTYCSDATWATARRSPPNSRTWATPTSASTGRA